MQNARISFRLDNTVLGFYNDFPHFIVMMREPSGEVAELGLMRWS